MIKIEKPGWYMTVTEAAQMAGVTRQSIWLWIKDGSLSSVTLPRINRAGKVYLVHKSDLTDRMQKRKRKRTK